MGRGVFERTAIDAVSFFYDGDDSSAQRSSLVESVQMLGVFDFSTTTITERPLRDPLETRQRPEALVVPVLRPLQ
jgi:hypothetical protein